MLLLLALLHLLYCKAQKQLLFDRYQVRLGTIEWRLNTLLTKPETIRISKGTIEFTADRRYVLTITGDRSGLSLSANDQNRIYRCIDQAGREVQVFLVDKEKMYVYFKAYHLLLWIVK